MENPTAMTHAVVYDSPRWSTLLIDREGEIYMSGVTAADFPVTSHRNALVIYNILALPADSTAGEIIAEIARRGLRLPCRAEATTHLDHLRRNGDKSLHVAFCFRRDDPDAPHVSAISQHQGGRFHYLAGMGQCIVKDARIITVVP